MRQETSLLTRGTGKLVISQRSSTSSIQSYPLVAIANRRRHGRCCARGRAAGRGLPGWYGQRQQLG